ncbi:MAG: hypothetical protein KF852_12450 [Saprospiraceae bacterium]|nr:hypothetical protein [Saprospiraceae bacterium]
MTKQLTIKQLEQLPEHLKHYNTLKTKLLAEGSELFYKIGQLKILAKPQRKTPHALCASAPLRAKNMAR